LDGFFLYIEQCYRKLFNDVVKRRFTENNWDYLFDYNYTRFENPEVKNGRFWNKHMLVFIRNTAERFRDRIIPRVKKGDNPTLPALIPSIPAAMFSKTLLPFYLLPTVFVCFAIYKGVTIKPQEENHTEVPVVVKVDSSTLVPLLQVLKKKEEEFITKDSVQ
jgi:hypothetical protein